VAVHLASVVTDLEAALDSPRPAKAATKALEDTMRTGTDRLIGAGGRLSGFKGPAVKLEGEHKPSLAWIELGGATYNLADKGRQKARRRIYAKGRRGRKGHAPALRTPAGPRRSVRGSRSRGKRITDTYAPKALDAATDAAQKVVADIFAKAV
jgi:hypothetical protein